MYKAIIIDDELMARELLMGMLNEYVSDIEVVDLCENLPSGIKSIHKNNPDVVFIDIEMPGYSGLDLLDFFNEEEVTFSIIFVTAYNQYAIQAFKLSAVDYLLKPLEKDDLITAVNLFKSKKDKQSYQVLKSNLSQGINKIAINTTNSVIFVSLSDVLFFKAEGSYTNVYLINNKNILSSKNLKYFEEVLQFNNLFFRCHKSYIVNLSNITEYVRSDGGYLKVQDHHVGISSDKVAVVLEKLKNLPG